ncbi:MAG: ribulokinase [Terriglobales bacterium]|jgi:L-ribulokinase
MAIVAGVDFGTLSVRVSIVDSVRGMLASAVSGYPIHRQKDDPEYATQSHDDHMRALALATRQAVKEAGIAGDEVLSIALDTTGSTVIPVGEGLVPLGEYYLWCDHRAKNEAAEITELAHREGLQAIQWCGGVYSSEWGFSKLLHWMRHNPGQRHQLVTALEHCDMVAATLCGITDPRRLRRSACAMGHKWLWNPDLGGLPPQSFLTRLDPLFEGIRAKLHSEVATSDKIEGTLSPLWAEQLGLRAGIPIPVGAFDAHWDAIGAGAQEGDVVNVVGTATCIMAYAPQAQLIPGVCGVVRGSIHPDFTGVEAGLSACGLLFNGIAERANKSVAELSKGLENYRAGQTGLLRMTWDNGDRTILVNPYLGGITLGWNVQHTPQDELFAAIEGTAFHTRIILDRMSEYGVPIRRVINGGGIPQNNPVLNQVYANILEKPLLVPSSKVTGLGSAIFAFLAAGAFQSIAEAQKQVCPQYTVYQPQPETKKTYDQLYECYRRIYFDFGQPTAESRFGDVLPKLIRVGEEQRGKS